MNPIIQSFLESADIRDTNNIFQIVCEYEDGRKAVKISLYPLQEGSLYSNISKEVKDISLDKFSVIYTDFTSQEISSGTERNRLYDLRSHRAIKYLRMFLPSGKVQIDYEDESVNTDFSFTISEYIRSGLEIIQ